MARIHTPNTELACVCVLNAYSCCAASLRNQQQYINIGNTQSACRGLSSVGCSCSTTGPQRLISAARKICYCCAAWPVVWLKVDFMAQVCGKGSSCRKNGNRGMLNRNFGSVVSFWLCQLNSPPEVQPSWGSTSLTAPAVFLISRLQG